MVGKVISENVISKSAFEYFLWNIFQTLSFGYVETKNI